MWLNLIIENELKEFFFDRYLNVLIVIFVVFGFGKSEEI